MKQAQILDCTLRDGAYLINKKFGDNVIKGIIAGLINANIDIIELGFLQDEGEGAGKTVYKNSVTAEKYLPSGKQKAKFSVLADYSRYSISNLDNYTGKSFDIIRACFFKKERYGVIDFCKEIKAKGYKLFIQPVDILGYSDKEILELIENVNQLEPYCFSIVDTFGSMYSDDLQRVYSLLHHNLRQDIKIGFHSHNNLQMSSALSQEFLKIAGNQRAVVVDSTISGMGRGAGNTPTELVAQYMVSKLGYGYNIDAILDLIDGYMDNIRTKCEWGYSTPFFIAGSYSAHVNNIAYLKEKNSIRSKDIRLILNEIGSQERKRYNYDLLEKTYLECVNSDIDDTQAFNNLKGVFENKNILIMAPGSTAKNIKEIKQYIQRNQSLVISINFLHNDISSDYIYFSNTKRYSYWENEPNIVSHKKIITSNVALAANNAQIISFSRLIKCGWNYMDCSAIMLMRLLDQLNVDKIGIVGLDGYDFSNINGSNYVSSDLEIESVNINQYERNLEIREMLVDFKETMTSGCKVDFIVPTRFSDIFGVNNED